MKNHSTVIKMRLVLVLFLLLCTSVFGQELQIEPKFNSEKWLSPSEAIAFKLSRNLEAEDGQLAMFMGSTDMTDLFQSYGDSVVYSPSFLLLPTGESEIVFYLVSSENQWQEITRHSLKVKTRSGFQKAEFTGKVNISNSGQVAEGHSPEENGPERPTYQLFSGQANLATEHVRDLFSVRSQWDFVGADEQEQALRFGEKGDAAAQIDLSSYLIQVQGSKLEFSAGHISHGRNQHLISSFGSRGSMIKYNLNPSIDLSMAILNAQSIVGWNNFTGMSRNRNRIYSGTFGLEVLNRPGALRVEGSLMDGSSLPLNDFNQGNINDAEKNRGYGFTLRASDGAERIRLEGGFTRSKFTNPDDELLSGDLELVPIADETKNAQFASLDVGVLQNLELQPNWQASLNLNIRHEKVDPLFRSLASYARADFLENAVALQGNLGAIAMQLAHNRSEDNLDDIPSILKTKTRSNTLALAIPLQMVFSRQGNMIPLLPSFSYNFGRTHQFGDQLPENSGFSESHVPDQVSKQHGVAFDWSGNSWQLGYRIAYSLQDNRQPGRENADFENISNTFSLGLNPLGPVDLNLGLAFENAENKEIERQDKTTNFSVGINVRTSSRSNLNMNFSSAHSADNAKTSSNDNINLSSQWSYNFNFNASPSRSLFSGQLFVRFNRTTSKAEDTTFGFESDLSNWTINIGVNVTLF